MFFIASVDVVRHLQASFLASYHKTSYKKTDVWFVVSTNVEQHLERYLARGYPPSAYGQRKMSVLAPSHGSADLMKPHRLAPASSLAALLSRAGKPKSERNCQSVYEESNEQDRVSPADSVSGPYPLFLLEDYSSQNNLVQGPLESPASEEGLTS